VDRDVMLRCLNPQVQVTWTDLVMLRWGGVRSIRLSNAEKECAEEARRAKWDLTIVRKTADITTMDGIDPPRQIGKRHKDRASKKRETER
jgi:hypothetical protein